MRLLISLMTVFVTMCASPVFAGSNSDEYGAAFSLNHGSGFQKYELGRKVIEQDVRDLRLTYDFSVSGGALGVLKLPIAKTPASSSQVSATLPKGAIVVGCYIDVITTPTSGGSATISIGTGQTATDILGATAIASYTGIVACTPTGSAATAIKLTADRVPTITIAVAALTAGKFNVHIQYALSD